MGNDEHSLGLEPDRVQFHHLEGLQAALEASLAAFKRDGEDLLENPKVSQPILFLIKYIRLVIRVNLSVLPLLFVAIVVLF